MNIKYVVTLDYHDYEFAHASDALSFARLAIDGGGRTRVIITMDAEREETTDEDEDEETED